MPNKKNNRLLQLMGLPISYIKYSYRLLIKVWPDSTSVFCCFFLQTLRFRTSSCYVTCKTFFPSRRTSYRRHFLGFVCGGSKLHSNNSNSNNWQSPEMPHMYLWVFPGGQAKVVRERGRFGETQTDAEGNSGISYIVVQKFEHKHICSSPLGPH